MAALLGSLEGTVKALLKSPIDGGERRTLKVQVPPRDRVCPEQESATSVKGTAGGVMAPIVRFGPPIFRTVRVLSRKLPAITPPKSTEAGSTKIVDRFNRP